jgi:lipopolysaccharide/colanic/teichoic acid biosynthesis glycosyltransferase
LEPDRLEVTATYTAISFAWSVAVFYTMRINQVLPRFFSSTDLRRIIIASATISAGTALTSFMLFRLDAIPRSFPLLHFLVMALAHALAQAWSQYGYFGRHRRGEVAPISQERNVLVIGCNRLAWFYIRMSDVLSKGQQRIVAIIDERPRYWGRSLSGRVVAGGIKDIPHILEEYAVHGVKVDRFIVAVARPPDDRIGWQELQELATKSGASVLHLPETLGFAKDAAASSSASAAPLAPQNAPGEYWAAKRSIDFTVAASLLLVCSPLFLLVAASVLVNIGFPVVFWQRRIGHHGAPLYVYKFRTLRAPFDRRGRRIPDNRRETYLGQGIRRMRLDELPQLWNIVNGEMSFIGPRPLLAVDHPDNDALRQLVPPGITGWAQVSGGRVVSIAEKAALDDWYVRHASFWLDVKIAFRTCLIVIGGDRRDEHAIRTALDEREHGPREAPDARTLGVV